MTTYILNYLAWLSLCTPAYGNSTSIVKTPFLREGCECTGMQVPKNVHYNNMLLLSNALKH